MKTSVAKKTIPAERKTRHRKLKILFSLLAVLVILRLLLPVFVLRYVNKVLASMDNYYGHVDDIDIALLRGAYVIHDIYINHLDTSGVQTPFFSSEVTDLSVEWGALFHGRLVGELEFWNPVLRFTRDKVEPGEVAKDTSEFRVLLDNLMPLKVNRFETYDGKIQYIDSTTSPVVDIYMTRTHMLAQNLSTVRDTALLPAEVTASADVYQGRLNFKMKLDPLANDPTYDLNMEVVNTNLPELNDFFKAYANFDVHRGDINLYMEMASKDRKFKGYVKPIIKHLDVHGPEDRHDSFLNQLWEYLVGAAGVILKNHSKHQLATKIPIEGEYGETSIGTWYAVTHVLSNAFIQAIYPSIDNQITIASVATVEPRKKEGFFKKLFSKNDSGTKNEKSASGKKQ